MTGSHENIKHIYIYVRLYVIVNVCLMGLVHLSISF